MKASDVISEARQILAQNSLTSWRVEISRGRRTVGYCDYRKRTIYFSKYHIEHDSVLDARETIVHEVAHALTPGDDHGDKWRSTALALGGNGKQYYNSDVGYPSKWSTTCINGHTPKLHRWDADTVYQCKCGHMLYIKRSDGTEIELSASYVRAFNRLAGHLGDPRIDRHGVPQI